MTCFEKFHKVIERIPADSLRIMSDQIGSGLREFLRRGWLVADGFVCSRSSFRYGVEWDEEIIIDEPTGTYRLLWVDSRFSISPKPIEDVIVYVPSVSIWIDDLSNMFGFEPSRKSRNPELIPGNLWHLGDLRISKSSRFVPIYLARQFEAKKEVILEELGNRIRSECGMVILANREGISLPAQLPRGHQVAYLEQLFLTDGHSLDKHVLEQISSPYDLSEGKDYFDERSGTLMLSHFDAPRVFIGRQKSVISLLWKNRGIEALKWADIRRECGCGKDPHSVFGANWSELLDRRGPTRGRYRLRAPKF